MLLTSHVGQSCCHVVERYHVPHCKSYATHPWRHIVSGWLKIPGLCIECNPMAQVILSTVPPFLCTPPSITLSSPRTLQAGDLYLRWQTPAPCSRIQLASGSVTVDDPNHRRDLELEFLRRTAARNMLVMVTFCHTCPGSLHEYR